MIHLPLSLAIATALLLGATDFRTGRMPNVITLGSLAGALLVRFLVEGGGGLTSAILGLAVVVAGPAALFVLSRGNAIGGGDVKALAALGAWLGPSSGLEVELGSLMLLAIYSLGKEAWHGRLLEMLKRSMQLLLPARMKFKSSRALGSIQPGETASTLVRFGPFLAVGTLAHGLDRWASLETLKVLLS